MKRKASVNTMAVGVRRNIPPEIQDYPSAQEELRRAEMEHEYSLHLDEAALIEMQFQNYIQQCEANKENINPNNDLDMEKDWCQRVIDEKCQPATPESDDTQETDETARLLQSQNSFFDESAFDFDSSLDEGVPSPVANIDLNLNLNCLEVETTNNAVPMVSEATKRMQERALMDDSSCNVYFLEGQSFRVSKRYKPIKLIGQGAYGKVVSAMDTLTGQHVAIKQISGAFDDVVDGKRILREIKLLQHFDHWNVLYLTDLLMPQSLSKFEDIYVVTPLLDTDLHSIIYSGQRLSAQHIQWFVYQLLLALKHIHSSGVVHRDIKPQNLLVNANCELRICDFGLARPISDQPEELDDLTEYVVTRWYRPPEILFARKDYGPKVDIWAVGCVLAEMFLRKPLFPGKDYLDMMRMICATCGKPTDDDLSFVVSRRGKKFVNELDYSDESKLLPNLFTFAERQPEDEDNSDDIPSAVENAQAHFVPIWHDAFDLLKMCLQFSPDNRPTVDEALSHPYFDSIRQSSDMVDSERFDFPENDMELEKPMLQELVFKEIARFNDNAREMMLEASARNLLIFPLAEDEFDQ